MPSSHYIMSRPSLYVARFFGTLHLADLLDGVKVCRFSANFDAAMPQLIDLTQVTAIELGFSDLGGFLNALESDFRHNDGDIAMFILTSGLYSYGSGRQFQLLADGREGVQVSVFDDTAECLAALKLPDRSVEDLLARATIIEAQSVPWNARLRGTAADTRQEGDT